ncbi:hypothetical protein HCJ76_32360 [Streptomyces sp. MC1]|nr:hypothetical protein [Streptomyces sp. MC1]
MLVTDSPDPAIAPRPPDLAGLVADTGSVLSHPAVMTREYGVPGSVSRVRPPASPRAHPWPSTEAPGRSPSASCPGSPRAGGRTTGAGGVKATRLARACGAGQNSPRPGWRTCASRRSRPGIRSAIASAGRRGGRFRAVAARRRRGRVACGAPGIAARPGGAPPARNRAAPCSRTPRRHRLPARDTYQGAGTLSCDACRVSRAVTVSSSSSENSWSSTARAMSTAPTRALRVTIASARASSPSSASSSRPAMRSR